MSTDISRDAWLSALKDAVDPGDPNSMTSSELGEILGISKRQAQIHAMRLVKKGRAKLTTKRITRSNGYTQSVQSYSLTLPWVRRKKAAA